MSISPRFYYSPIAPERSAIDASSGALLLQFGVDWCAHCQAAEPAIVQALQAYPGLLHLCIEDGAGRALGRSFKVKLWPTLVLLQDGQEVARLVRPTQWNEVQALMRLLTDGPAVQRGG
ncbi:MAG: thioredoxin family protein [Rhodoferax sp.]